MTLEIETLKALDKDKIYWMQIDCSGLPDSKANEKIDATFNSLRETPIEYGLRFILTDENGTIHNPKEFPEHYIEPYFFGWVESQGHPELTTVKLPSDIMYDCEKNESADVGDYVEVRWKDFEIIEVIKKEMKQMVKQPCIEDFVDNNVIDLFVNDNGNVQMKIRQEF